MKKLLTYCSLLGIALSGYQPALAKKISFDDGKIQINVPESDNKGNSVEHESVPLQVNGQPVKTENKKQIIYTWNLQNTMGNNTGSRENGDKGKFCNNTQPRGVYYWEIKLYPKLMVSNSKSYLARYFNFKLHVGGLTLTDAQANQRIRVNKNGTVNFRLELDLKKDEALYNRDIDYTIKAGTKLAVVSIFCEDGSYINDQWINHQSLYNKFTGIELIAAEDTTLHFSRTCRINGSRNLQVNLSPVRKLDLEQKRDGRIQGGEFTLTLDCSNAEVQNAYIMFTDGFNQSNTNRFLTTKNGSTIRDDVKLLIKDGSNDVYYGPVPTSPIVLKGDKYTNMKEFGSKNGSTISKRYTVYYQRTTPRTVEPGEVQGKVIYNFYYN